MIARERVMRRLFYISTLLCIFVVAAAAEILPELSSNAADHVVTLIEHPGYGTEEHLLTVMHHGNWTRVDRIDGEQLTTEYVGHGVATEVRVYRRSDRFQAVFTMPSTDNGPSWETSARKTDERRTVLGEPCTVWNVKRERRPAPGRKGLEKRTCISDDGIELSYEWIGSLGNLLSSAQATHVERRPVDPDDVRPPRGLLALDWWDQVGSAPTMLPIPDYETVMRPDSPAADESVLIRTTRHHDPWTYVEESKAGVLLNVTISHALNWTRVAFHDDGEQKQLAITKSRQPSTLQEPKDLNKSEIVLGESCRWFDLIPEIMDVGLCECRTKDHIALKHEERTRGRHYRSAAVRIARRAIDPSEVRPPAPILDPLFWGLD
jgi:hypothetical protein